MSKPNVKPTGTQPCGVHRLQRDDQPEPDKVDECDEQNDSQWRARHRRFLPVFQIEMVSAVYSHRTKRDDAWGAVTCSGVR